MNVELEPVGPEDKPVLRELLNLYLYDFSPFGVTDPDPHGRFEYRWLDHYWTEADRHPFFIRAEGKRVGFALVRVHDGVRSLAELFVLRRHRNAGIGAAAARQVFDLFPGRWRVGTQPNNVRAQAFWRRTLDAITGGVFSELNEAEAWGNRPVFVFEHDTAAASGP